MIGIIGKVLYFTLSSPHVLLVDVVEGSNYHTAWDANCLDDLEPFRNRHIGLFQYKKGGERKRAKTACRMASYKVLDIIY